MLLKLVTHQADHVMKMFDKLAQTFDTWFDDAMKEMQAGDLPQELVGMIKSFTFKQLTSAVGGFHLRVVTVTRKQQS